MLIIASLYAILVWLVFSRLKLIRWGWVSGTLAVIVGAFILAVFLAMFNYLTPSGGFVIVSRVVEVTPNVSGRVIDDPGPAERAGEAGNHSVPDRPGALSIQGQAASASLVQAKQQAQQLKANYEQATANVEGLTKQLAYQHQTARRHTRRLTGEHAQTEFREQDTQVQYETVQFQLQAAKAAQQSAKLAMDSEIGGVNTTVASTQAQLDNAKWELEQTTVRAPGDGYVTVMAARRSATVPCRRAR